MDLFHDTDICIDEEKIISFKPLDNDFLHEEAIYGYEIKFDDCSFTTIEVLKGN